VLFVKADSDTRHLDVRDNGVILDSVCATALKLDTMSLESLISITTVLPVAKNAALSQDLQGPCTLKELMLRNSTTQAQNPSGGLDSNVSLEVLDCEYMISHNGACQFFELFPR
jgi:hypothetical protein